MSETAVLENHDIDPANQVPLSMAYETERGTAYGPINPRTGEAIRPHEGINVEIMEQWAADEVAAEIGNFEAYLSGEGDQEQTLEASINNLSYLSVLHLGQEHVDAIAAASAARGDGGWRWKPETTGDAIAHDQLSILSNMMKGSDTLTHFTSFGAPLLKSGALKPKAGHDEYRSLSGDNTMMEMEGVGAVKEKIGRMAAIREEHRQATQNPEARYTGYMDGLGLHSQLVHFSESPVESPLSTTFYYPRSAIMKRTPIAMIGQDAEGSTSVPGIKTRGDEAHHGRDKQPQRDRFTEVYVDVSPEVAAALQPRRQSMDITFMAATDSAEHAVDFEYPIEESVLFVKEYDARNYIYESIQSDVSDSVFPKSVQELCASPYEDSRQGLKEGDFSLKIFAAKARTIQKEMAQGKEYQYSSPRSEAFWNDIVGRMNTLEAQIVESGNEVSSNPENMERLAETVLLRRVLEAAGHSPEWTNNNVFMANGNMGKGAYDTFAVQAANAVLKRADKGTYFVQAKTEDLQFDQLDLAMQLPVYRR